MKARFSLKMCGERKAVIEAVAHIVCKPVVYTKAPLFAYETEGWSIDRDGVLTSPVFNMEAGILFNADLIGTLGRQGFTAEGPLSVTIYPDELVPTLLYNIGALLDSKASLIQAALGVEYKPSVMLSEEERVGFVFPFYPAAMTFPGILAAVQFSERICAQAFLQKKVTAKDRPVENEKYAMRCFLLRIGMIGREYAVARKELLSKLPGNSSFKNTPRPPEEPAAEPAPQPGAEPPQNGENNA